MSSFVALLTDYLSGEVSQAEFDSFGAANREALRWIENGRPREGVRYARVISPEGTKLVEYKTGRTGLALIVEETEQ